MGLSAIANGMRNVRDTHRRSAGGVQFDLFFDRNAVITRMDRKELKVLSRTGSWGRGFIRRSMKSGGKRGKASAPGEPPRFHSRGFVSFKDGIFFNANLDEGSVDIGASKLRSRVRSNQASGAQLQEEGGHGMIRSFRYNKNRSHRYTTRPARWRPRPFIKPALKPTSMQMLEFMENIEL